MKLLKFIPLQLTIALVSGLLSGRFFQVDQGNGLSLLAALFTLMSLAYIVQGRSYNRSRSFALCSLVLFYVYGLVSINRPSPKTHYSILTAQTHGSPLMVIEIKKSLRSNKDANRYLGELEQIDKNRSRGVVLVHISKKALDSVLLIGEKLVTNIAPIPINSPLNPHQFDYRKYLEDRRIKGQVYLGKNEFTLCGRTSMGPKIWAQNVRTHITKALVRAGLGPDELSMITALLLGQRTGLSEEIIEDYRRAGTIHVLAISGLHIGIILALINFVLRPLNHFQKGKSLQLIFSLIILWSFALIAGLSPSVVRAVTMFSAVAFSLFGKRSNTIYHNLTISIFLLLLIRPSYLFEIGFQLSYLAVFGIVLIQPLLNKLWRPKWVAVRYFWQLFTVSICAQIGVLPLSLFSFHQFPSLFFLSNLVVLPLLTCLLILGVLLIILTQLKSAPSLLVELYTQLIQLLNSFIAWVANQEAFIVEHISFSGLEMLSTYLLLGLSIAWIYYKTTRRLEAVFLAILVWQSVQLYERWNAETKNEWVIFNRNKASLLARKEGRSLKVYHTQDQLEIADKTLIAYQTGSNTNVPVLIKGLPTSELYKRRILLIDSLGLYPSKSSKGFTVFLVQSPKINLERMIKVVAPRQIIVDNSNYRSFVHRWKASCRRLQIPFHYTGEDGAWISPE